MTDLKFDGSDEIAQFDRVYTRLARNKERLKQTIQDIDELEWELKMKKMLLDHLEATVKEDGAAVSEYIKSKRWEGW